MNETTTRGERMEDAVNAHVLDHLVHGPAAHRALMDAARSIDARLRELEEQRDQLVGAMSEVLRLTYEEPYSEVRVTTVARDALARVRGEAG